MMSGSEHVSNQVGGGGAAGSRAYNWVVYFSNALYVNVKKEKASWIMMGTIDLSQADQGTDGADLRASVICMESV